MTSSNVFIVGAFNGDFKQISRTILVFPLFTLIK